MRGTVSAWNVRNVFFIEECIWGWGLGSRGKVGGVRGGCGLKMERGRDGASERAKGVESGVWERRA